ncbi:MAG: hypothetical protein ETSY1_11670 [Candidatus Entotheonella factor]|uniref:HAMP domain-containing protein n=2 Tax=Candidatus Entotheonella TaxID=93171 RepID=W4LR24_ENTF1|nr:MAG: hypothetical protein ETSY1_11670 [Candidatus Entotheonella factor]
MKLKIKFNLIFIILSLLVAIIGYINTVTQNKVISNFENIVKTEIPSIIALENVKNLSLRMLQEATSYAFLQFKTKNEPFDTKKIKEGNKESEKEEFYEARENLHKYLDEFTRLSNNQDINILVQDIHNVEYKLYQAELNLIHLKTDADINRELLRIQDTLEEIEEEFLSLIDLAIAAKLEEFNAAQAKAEGTALRAKQINIVLFLIALGSALALGNLVSRMVMRPLFKLKEAAIAIGGGQLDTCVQIQSRDEIGELANAFNDMAADLRSSRTALSQARDELELRVNERTAELRNAHRELEMRVAERTGSLRRFLRI